MPVVRGARAWERQSPGRRTAPSHRQQSAGALLAAPQLAKMSPASPVSLGLSPRALRLCGIRFYISPSPPCQIQIVPANLRHSPAQIENSPLRQSLVHPLRIAYNRQLPILILSFLFFLGELHGPTHRRKNHRSGRIRSAARGHQSRSRKASGHQRRMDSHPHRNSRAALR